MQLCPTQVYSRAEMNIWVLVIGISDYQYLNDLQYADDDALAFYQYVKRSLGHRIQADQMKLLLNQEATFAEIWMSFEWLLRNVKEHDRVYIYFSGHGGHEDMTIAKLGYLHAYDSHDATYNNGGNIDLNLLDNILKTFSHRGAKTFLFLDACHSGKIVGDDYLFLNNSLATKVPNIVKILSAQGEERSYEHSRWGGGHGVFTYYLLEAILGYADNAPKNGVVSLYELEKYLIEKVPLDTEYRQIPIVIASNKRENIFPAIDKSLKLEEGASASISNLINTTERSFLLEELTKEDKEILTFREFLAEYHLMKDDLDLLFSEYETIRQSIIDDEKKNQLLDQLIAEVLNSTQFYINTFIGVYEGDPVQLNYSDAKYRISAALTKTLTIVDDGYPGYQLLFVRRIFFESEKAHDGYHKGVVSKNGIKKAIDDLNYAIELDPNSSYLRYQVGVLSWHINDFDVARIFLNQARDFSPNWSFPEIVLGNLVSETDRESSIYHYRNALHKKPEVPKLYNIMADFFMAEADHSSNSVKTRINYDSAVFYFKKAAELMDSAHGSYNYEIIANIYEDQYKEFGDGLYLAKSITNYRKALLSSSENTRGLSAALGNNYLILDPASNAADFYDGIVISYENLELGMRKFRSSFESGFSDWEIISILPEFITKTPDFMALMEEFKPD